MATSTYSELLGIRTLRWMFAAVFFVFFGLQTNPADLPPMAGPALALAAAGITTKLATIFEIFNGEQDAVNSFFPGREIKAFDILEFVKGQKRG